MQALTGSAVTTQTSGPPATGSSPASCPSAMRPLHALPAPHRARSSRPLSASWQGRVAAGAQASIPARRATHDTGPSGTQAGGGCGCSAAGAGAYEGGPGAVPGSARRRGQVRLASAASLPALTWRCRGWVQAGDCGSCVCRTQAVPAPAAGSQQAGSIGPRRGGPPGGSVRAAAHARTHARALRLTCCAERGARKSPRRGARPRLQQRHALWLSYAAPRHGVPTCAPAPPPP